MKNVTLIDDALLASMIVIEQDSINERGEIGDKTWLTHNQSKILNGYNTSVNSIVIGEKIQDCMYGHYLLQVIYQVVDYRRLYPNKKIVIRKID